MAGRTPSGETMTRLIQNPTKFYHYAVGKDMTDGLISPVFADLRGLPPMFGSTSAATKHH